MGHGHHAAEFLGEKNGRGKSFVGRNAVMKGPQLEEGHNGRSIVVVASAEILPQN